MTARVVLDTNTLLKCLVSDRGPRQSILDSWLGGRYILAISPYLIEEAAYVLSRPRIMEYIRITDGEREQLIEALRSQALVTEGDLWLTGVAPDPKDDPIVSCAVEAQADLIITGNASLLNLVEYQGTKIITPRRWSVELLLAEENV